MPELSVCLRHPDSSKFVLLLTGGFAIDLLEDFHRYLADQGVTLTELSRAESFAITKRWTSVFTVQSDDLLETRGLKGIDQWLNAPDDHLLLLFLSARITAFPISKNSRPCTAHRYSGRTIDVSAYNELEFAVFPETYEWTLIYTHEDGAFGGPYFIRNEGTPSKRD